MLTPPSLRVLALLLVAALGVVACADRPVADSPDAPSDEAAARGAPTSNVTSGCVDDPQAEADYFPDKVEFDEATGVDVAYSASYKTIEVTPPGDGDPIRYVLHQCGAPEPVLDDALADAQVIQVPVDDIVSLTTTNLPHLDELDAVDRLVGVGTAGFVTTESVRERIAAGEVDEFADAEGQPDLERLVAAAPGLLVVDGFGDTVADDVARYTDAGIATVINADFNEQTLLGRAEWLKFTALFLNAEAEATAVYDDIAERYADVTDRVQTADEQPTVFVNTPFEGTWFTPGGASFLADAIADAGGEYVFAEDDQTGGLQVDFETMLDAAADADVWIQAGSVTGSLDDLLAQDERFAQFQAFDDGAVWAYDLQVTEGGGNAVFETAYTRADLFLADLAKIFHPEAFEDHDFAFFGPVPAGG
ncbi:MAG: ABC transporter substrate-binding protein [Egibacteraceae bacterium]